MQITRACRDRDRPLLSLGWSRLCVRAAEGVSTVGVTAAASAQGQAGEVAAVARIAKERAQEEAVSNSTLTENHRHGLDNDNSPAREEQERRTKRLVSEQRLRYRKTPKEIHVSVRPLGVFMHRAVRFIFRTRSSAAGAVIPVQIERLCRDREKILLFHGWSRICMHAAAAARAPLVGVEETDEATNSQKAEVPRTVVGTSMNVVAATGTMPQEAAETSKLAAKLKRKDDELKRLLREQHIRRVSRWWQE